MALPPSKHQHCTDEAHKAETVLSAVSYIYIKKYTTLNKHDAFTVLLALKSGQW